MGSFWAWTSLNERSSFLSLQVHVMDSIGRPWQWWQLKFILITTNYTCKNPNTVKAYLQVGHTCTLFNPNWCNKLCFTEICGQFFDWLRLTKESSSFQLSFGGGAGDQAEPVYSGLNKSWVPFYTTLMHLFYLPTQKCFLIGVERVMCHG